MFETETLLTLIPALPLAAAIVTSVCGRLLGPRSHLPVVVAVAASCALSMVLLREVSHRAAEADQDGNSVGYEEVYSLWTWADVGQAYLPAAGQAAFAPQPDGAAAPPAPRDFRIEVALRADPLTAVMLLMVTFVSTLVAVYASGYMHGDRGYWRFFSYIGLFVFSMTMLVSVSSFALLYVFWEAVGVCSYLLIGFWYEKPEAAAAGKKAFLVNRVGDFGFALGVLLIWVCYGTLDFHDTLAPDGSLASAGVLGQWRLSDPALLVGGGLGLAIALLLFVGACGKSAQFPLHVWLPDAMEGPTPVSALIHAATMVTAGVYMVARCAPLFFVSAEALAVVAAIGGFTALLAALVALTQNDLKRVLAYSTISQLGYMFLGLGTGTLAGMAAGMFHLFTHAFFKALLFLGAGSVMHAMGGVIDMRRFGGLRRLMPWTHRTFWFGALALAGVVPLAGFWSKDAILGAVHDTFAAADQAAPYAALYRCLYYSALVTALLTAFYTFRALFLTFYGPTRLPPEAGHHAHESPPVMTVPLVILAFFSLVVGAVFELTAALGWSEGFLFPLRMTPSLAFAPLAATWHGHHFHLDVAALGTLVALAGLGLAAYLYLGERRQLEHLSRWMARLRLHQLSLGKFFFDEIYAALVVAPLRTAAGVCYFVDRWLVDGLVNLVGRVPLALGAVLRTLQGGLVQFYALAMMLGLLVLIGALLMWPGS